MDDALRYYLSRIMIALVTGVIPCLLEVNKNKKSSPIQSANVSFSSLNEQEAIDSLIDIER